MPAGLMSTGQSRDFAAEIARGAVDALAQPKAHKARDLDRRADFRLGLFDGLGHGLLALFNGVALLQEANLFVVSSKPRLDDLLDDVGRLALGLGGERALL